jgi:hypothetical protein
LPQWVLCAISLNIAGSGGFVFSLVSLDFLGLASQALVRSSKALFALAPKVYRYCATCKIKLQLPTRVPVDAASRPRDSCRSPISPWQLGVGGLAVLHQYPNCATFPQHGPFDGE